MKRIDKYDLTTKDGLFRLLNGNFKIDNTRDLKNSIDYLFEDVPSKKRYELLENDEDLVRMAEEHQKYCNDFKGVCREECKYGSYEHHSCFVNYLLEEIEVED